MQRRALAATLAATAAAGTAAAGTAAAQNAGITQQVAYHIGDDGGPDRARWRTALNNMRNHFETVGNDNLSCIAVLNSGGVKLLQAALADPSLSAPISALRARGARFLVCANSLLSQGIVREQLFEVPSTDIVASGVVELTQLQHDGYAYIRP
jgi:intracellular sulfur oxidation DsrE/DsrF family protein